MKTTIATALSLVGVLAAGSAAALVNTTIFDTTPSDAAASAAVLPEGATIDLTIPTPVTVAAPAAVTQPVTDGTGSTGTASAPATTRPATPVTINGSSLSTAEGDAPTTTLTTVPASPSTTTPSTPSTTTPAPAPTPTTTPTSRLTTYNLGAVGSVTLDVVNGRLVVVDTSPSTGWRVTEAYLDAMTGEVEVTFASIDTEVEFTAALSGGSIVTDLSSRLLDTDEYEDDHDGDHEHDDDDEDDDDDDDHDDDDHDDD